MRGQLTEEINRAALRHLGTKEISQGELRLMPYIQHMMVNNQRIEPGKISPEERDILSTWRTHGWIEGGASGLSITKEFWDAINEILWIGYVAHES